MPKFSVSVTVKATFTYQTEVDARDERQARELASSAEVLEQNMPEDFTVAAGYCTYDEDAEAITGNCPRCAAEHPIPHRGVILCDCDAIGAYPGEFWADGDPIHISHPKGPDGACIAPPWWHEDDRFCAACGSLEVTK